MEMRTIVREQMGDQDKRGRINGQSQIRTNGIPPRQPSLGVLANYYSAAILEIFTRESAQNPHRTPRRYQTQQSNASDSRTTRQIVIHNIRQSDNQYEKAAESVRDGDQMGRAEWIKFDMNKVDYMYFTRLHKRKISPIPPVLLPT